MARGSFAKVGSMSGVLMLVCLLAACGDAAEPQTRDRIKAGSAPGATMARPSDCQTFSITSFPLGEDPKLAVVFDGNTEIFEATVQRAEPATKVIPPGKNLPFLIYVPVYMTVTKVYKGTASEGATAVLRDLGGTAADCTSFDTDSIRDSVWMPGTKIFVFANEATSFQGKTALTPNWVFLEEDGIARSAVDPAKTMDLQEMQARVANRWPRP